ncbi:MAG: PQQ-dependent sugar dehydrogenase [Chloroflexales bacterium]|nr:PQQ-dependent sugar dehydrogenase [Chloroflexales bacterium]
MQAQSGSRLFPETGLRVGGRFLSFWDGNGGLPVFGYPNSDQRGERGREGVFTTQWFERERFELHPENLAPYDVLLGRLGDELLRRQGRDWRSFPKGQGGPGCQLFSETGHGVCGPFLAFWQGHGLEFDGRRGTGYAESLALFGLPLSEAQTETNSSGATVLTQWFERARFEYLPENPDPYKVLLGRLGAEAFDPQAGNGPTQYHQVRQPNWPAPLEVPVGFTVEEAASGLRGPRFMALDSDGSIVYGSSSTSEVVRLRDTNGDGRYETARTVAGGLPFVHSVAFVNGQLLAAAETQVVRLGNFDANDAARSTQVVIDNLPSGATDLYGHRTRTLIAGLDGKLYLSVGSSCDVCQEDTPLRAAVLRANADGGGLEVFASGLRNSVGIAFRPFTNELWGADMGRNNIGDGIPPEELNLLAQGRNYGWPYCYGARVPNPEYNDAARCAASEAPKLTFPAHWAPLGLAFYDQVGFPPSYSGNAIIAFHGSAKDQIASYRSGYNVVRVRFNEGQPTGYEDLVRGWVVNNEAWGRPAGVLVLPDGSVLISDDSGGRIFRVRYTG